MRLLSAIRLGFVAAAYFGLLVGLEIAGPNCMWESGRDLALLLIWTAVLFGVAGGILSLAAAAFSALRRRKAGFTVFLALAAISAVFTFADLFGWCYPCHQFLDWRHPHLGFTPIKSLLMTLGIGLISIGVGAVIGGASYAVWSSWKKRTVRTGFSLFLAALLGIAGAASYLSTPGRHEPKGLLKEPECAGGTPRLLIIVDEALTWDVADVLIKEGKLPAVRRLVENGVRGELARIRPCLSHPLWATLATGRKPVDHGIGSKISYAYPGMRRGIAYFDVPVPMMLEEIFIKLGRMGFGGSRPLGTGQRRVKAIWNIASDCGVEVGVVGGRITWPAEEVKGFMVSDKLHEEAPEDHVFPPGLEETVAGAVDVLPEVRLERFISCPLEGLAEDPRAGPRFEPLERNLSNDLAYHLAASKILETYDPRLMILGFLSMDGIGHYFYWEHSLLHDPQEYRLNWYLYRFTSQEIVDCFGKVIENAYAFHDSLIGLWIDWVGDDGSIIIASDHGFEMNGSNHYYGPPGILIMCGEPFKKGASITGATLFDIAPTVLYLLGLPVPEDMEGRLLSEALDPRWLASNPIRTIPTYE